MTKSTSDASFSVDHLIAQRYQVKTHRRNDMKRTLELIGDIVGVAAIFGMTYGALVIGWAVQ